MEHSSVHMYKDEPMLIQHFTLGQALYNLNLKR